MQNEPLDHTLAVCLKALAINTEEILDRDFAISLIMLQEALVSDAFLEIIFSEFHCELLTD